MLVLSRRQDDKVVFPNLGITVKVLRLRGNVVRLGIDAPSDVKILREEIAGQPTASVADDPDTDPEIRRLRHELHNRLHTAKAALNVLQRKLGTGGATDGETALQRALSELAALDRSVSLKSESSAASVGEKPARRALVVEDNPHERELLAGCLRMSGYIVDAVEDGLAAMRYLAEKAKPDCVLLDMRMPRLNGPKTVSAIRGNPKYAGIKLFAVSGSRRDEFELRSGKRGVDRWFQKPLDPSALLAELDRDLEGATKSSSRMPG